MMCKVENCRITRRGSIRKAKCWREHQLCTKHAVEMFPEDYSNHFIISMTERYSIKKKQELL